MHAAVVVFPGSNCDRDLAVAFRNAGARVTMVWHKDTDLPDGRRYRRHSGRLFLWRLPALRRHRRELADLPVGGGPCASGRLRAGRLQRLPGADRNRAAAGRADAQCGPEVHLQDRRPEGRDRRIAPLPKATTPATRSTSRSRITMATTLPMTRRIARLQRRGPDRLHLYRQPQRLAADIAGVLSENRRVLGMMPHPERAADTGHGGTDGLAIFRALTQALATA